MTQFNTTVARRSSGDLDVYTGILGVALILLAVGVVYMAMTNISHSASSATANDGGMFKLVQKPGR
jgi:hypothetical protein